MSLDAGTIVIRLLADAKGVVAGFGAATGQVKGFSRNMESMGASMKSAGDKWTKYVTLPIVAAGAVSAKFALDFEDSMTNIEALVGVGAKDMATYRQAIMDLAPAVGIGPKELADALYFVTSSGLKGGAALRALRASALASAAGLGQTMTVADAVTSAINAYGESNLSAARATDILLAAVREGKSEPEEFAGSIGRVIPMASKMKVSFGEVAGIMAAMSLNGTDANEAVTQISAVLASAIKPTKDGAAALRDVGMTYADLRREIAEKGLTATIADLNEKFHGNIETLGELFPNIRALRGFLALTGAEADKYAGIIDKVSKAHGDAAKASAVALSKPGAELKKAWAEVQVQLVETGDILLPFLADGAKLVTSLARGFGGLSDDVKKLVVGLAAAAAVAGPLLSVLGRIAMIKLAFGGAGSLSGIAAGASRATDKVALLGDAALTTGKGLRGMTVGTAAGLGVIGVAAGSLLVVLEHINAETEAANKLADEYGKTFERGFLQNRMKQFYSDASEGLAEVTRQMNDHKVSVSEGQVALRHWIDVLNTALSDAKRLGNREMVQQIRALIGEYKTLAGSADDLNATMGKPIRMHNTQLKADIAEAKTRIGELKERIHALGLLEPTPKVKADIAEAKRKLKEAQDKLRELNREKANPKVTVNNSLALSALDQVIHRMSLIHDIEATVTISRNIMPAHVVGGSGSYQGGNQFGQGGRKTTMAPANPFAGMAAEDIDLVPPQFEAAWLGAIDHLQRRYQGLLDWAAKIPEAERWKGLATTEGKWQGFLDFLGKAQGEYQGLLDAAAQVQADIVSLTGTIMGTVNLWPQYVETVGELGEKVRELQLPTVEIANPDDLSRVMDANVANMREWVANMDKLRAAGLPKELLDELTAMGLGGAGQVAGLAAMTAEQLATWTGGWLELQKLAGQQAQATFKDASEAAVAAINDFTAALLAALEALGMGAEAGTVVGVPGAASGGIVRKRTLVMVGEGGSDEAILPLPAGWRTNAAGALGGGDVYNFTVDARGSSDPAAVEAAAERGARRALVLLAELRRR